MFSFGFVFGKLHHVRRIAFPSDPPSEEGSPGEVRSRCPTPATFWLASLATGPAGLSQRGVSAGFRKANCLAVRRANGRDSGEPSARRAGEAGRASLPTFSHEQESRSPAGASPGKAKVGACRRAKRFPRQTESDTVRTAKIPSDSGSFAKPAEAAGPAHRLQ